MLNLNKKKYFWSSIFFTLAAVILIAYGLLSFFGGLKNPSAPTEDYWIWRSTDLDYIKPNSRLIIYQGDYLLGQFHTPFIKRGLTPGEIPTHKDIALLVRLYQLDKPETLAKYISLLVSKWKTYQINVSEIQLDYDSPSSQLAIYADFIAQLNSALKINNIQTDISITGLLTWLDDSPMTLQQLAKEVAYIDYQLYNDFYPLANLARFYPSIGAIKHSYKIGVTTAHEFEQLQYPKTKYYLGKSIFLNINKDKRSEF